MILNYSLFFKKEGKISRRRRMDKFHAQFNISTVSLSSLLRRGQLIIAHIYDKQILLNRVVPGICSPMVILLLSIVLLLVLVGLKFLHLKNNKTLAMVGIVMGLLLLNIIEEVTMPNLPHQIKAAPNGNIPDPESKVSSSLPHHYMLNSSRQIFGNTPTRSLNKEERMLLNSLTQKVQKEGHDLKCILVLNNIEEARFRAIFKQLQAQLLENGKGLILEALEIDYDVYQYGAEHFEMISLGGSPLLALVSAVRTLQQLSHLETVFLSRTDVSLLFINPPKQLFGLSPLSKWAQVINFEGNYISQVLENHPPRLVQICHKYRTIDYSFYVLSQSEPLSQLCTKLPTNRVTECIRRHLDRHEDLVAYGKVRQCWGEGQPHDVEGVLFENGMVGVKKDYFYAGKVQKKEFLLEGDTEFQSQNRKQL